MDMTTISPTGELPRTSAAATLDSHAPTSRSERERIHDANTPWVTTMFGGMMLAAGGGVTSVIGAYS